MTILNLDVTLAPRSIALVGATAREGAVGRVVLENVLRGDFDGRIYPVNLKYDEVLGRPCWRRIADLPEPPDVVIVMTPADTVPEIISELGERGTKVAVVLSAGVTNSSGLRQRMLDAARPHRLRVIGPNTIGLLAPRARLNASFVHIAPKPGRLGLISQSGAMVSSIVDWAAAQDIGFSQLYSLGDMADVDVGDCLNMLAMDDHTAAILMYLESIPDPRKFMSAARAASRLKSVIAVKPGRHAEAAKAAATHTGALAGADRVIDAALRRAGVIRVDDLGDLFDAAEITGRYRPLRSGRVAIITNGGGAGVLAVDKLIDDKAALASLSPDTIATLDAALPPTWSRANPVDIIGDAPPQRYRAAIDAVAADPGVDALLVMNCPTALADPSAAAGAVADSVQRGLVNGKPLLACWLGSKAAAPAREVLRAAGIGEFETPAQAAEAIALLTRWSSLLEQLQRVPSDRGVSEPDARRASVLRTVAAEGRTLLSEDEAKDVLAAYGVPVPETIFATTAEAVEVAAARLLETVPAVVVKVRSTSITHKSDIGGVVLNLTSAAAARQAAATIADRLSLVSPPLAYEGFTVQPMIQRAGRELIVGMSTDPSFGPVLLFGEGGTAVEVIDDTATDLVPLDDVLASDMIDRTRVSRLLAGYRDVPAADRQAIVDVLLAVSQLAVDFPLIQSIDINPLLAGPAGVMALDARITIVPARAGIPPPNPVLAIRPYPADATNEVEIADHRYLVRPIKPADVALYPAFLARVTAEDMRLRFLSRVNSLSQQMLIRLTQLDYDRDMAFIAIDQPSGELAGIARYAADPDRRSAEFGVHVRSDLKGHGLGRMLLETLIAYAGGEGIGRLYGEVLRDNVNMLALCRELGFVATSDEDPSLRRVTLPLRAPESDPLAG